nr:ABC transporter permease [uncultured Brevundimonas sp.]
MISLARKTLIHEWVRFVPVVLAVTFAGLLLIVQAALVLGIFSSAAIYIKASSADVWVGYPGLQSFNYGRPLGPDVEMRLRADEAVSTVEPWRWVDADWHSASDDHGAVTVYLSGLSVEKDAMAFSRLLPDALRQRLRDPGAVIVDSADLTTLGVAEGGLAWINKHPVRVVGVIKGMRGLGGVNVLSSLDTAREIGGAETSRDTYYLARLKNGVAPGVVRQRLMQDRAAFSPYEAWTADEFAARSQNYWLLDTGAGIAVLFMAIIVSLVGAMVTSQSLAGTISASRREYAALSALGVGRWSLTRVVLEQSAWIGGVGLVLAALISTPLLMLAAGQDVPVAMSLPVATGCGLLIFAMAMLASLAAVRTMLKTDPAMLLR